MNRRRCREPRARWGNLRIARRDYTAHVAAFYLAADFNLDRLFDDIEQYWIDDLLVTRHSGTREVRFYLLGYYPLSTIDAREDDLQEVPFFQDYLRPYRPRCTPRREIYYFADFANTRVTRLLNRTARDAFIEAEYADESELLDYYCLDRLFSQRDWRIAEVRRRHRSSLTHPLEGPSTFILNKIFGEEQAEIIGDWDPTEEEW